MCTKLNLIVINNKINKLKSKVSQTTTCCLRVFVVMVSDTCVPRPIVIGIAINQLDTKVSLKTICCLRLYYFMLLFTNM